MTYTTVRRQGTNGDANRLYHEDQTIHRWYRLILSFPPHLVRDYLQKFGIAADQQVLDPFCGTGTTLVECKKLGINSVGIEAHPVAYFASSVKLDWSPDPDGLLEHATKIAKLASAELAAQDIDDIAILRDLTEEHLQLRALPLESEVLLLKGSISPLPLHKVLVLIELLENNKDNRYHKHELLALAKALSKSISNLKFGPEVGVGSIKLDAPVIAPWYDEVCTIADDLRKMGSSSTAATVYNADARQVEQLIKPQTIDAVITSPPYPNEKDYTRTMRLESVVLGLINNKLELRALKQQLVRSNTRSVYKADDDDTWIAACPEIQQIADAIEERRIKLGKTSGFERRYATSPNYTLAAWRGTWQACGTACHPAQN